MAEDTTYDVTANPTLYFYVDKSTQEVAGVYMYSIFGITTRDKGGDWRVGDRETDSLKDFQSNDYEVYAYDWDSEPILGKDSDPKNDDEWSPTPVKDWGTGKQITVEDIKPYTRKVDVSYADNTVTPKPSGE
jgi:hypothetical protein